MLRPLRTPDGGPVSGNVSSVDRAASIFHGWLTAVGIRVHVCPPCIPDLEPDGFFCISGMGAPGWPHPGP